MIQYSKDAEQMLLPFLFYHFPTNPIFIPALKQITNWIDQKAFTEVEFYSSFSMIIMSSNWPKKFGCAKAFAVAGSWSTAFCLFGQLRLLENLSSKNANLIYCLQTVSDAFRQFPQIESAFESIQTNFISVIERLSLLKKIPMTFQISFCKIYLDLCRNMKLWMDLSENATSKVIYFVRNRPCFRSKRTLWI